MKKKKSLIKKFYDSYTWKDSIGYFMLFLILDLLQLIFYGNSGFYLIVSIIFYQMGILKAYKKGLRSKTVTRYIDTINYNEKYLSEGNNGHKK